MNVVLFGASGMVGQGVLRECLADPGITEVRSIVRTPTGNRHPKLIEIVHDNFLDFSPLAPRLRDLDACFYSVGISSIGVSVARYRRVTRDFTLAAANTLLAVNPSIRFLLVSAVAADSSERSHIPWRRIKGETENAILQFASSYVLRPSVIRPLHGIRSRTPIYRIFYQTHDPVLPLFQRLIPSQFTDTDILSRAMLRVARDGYPRRILETSDINALGAAPV